MMEMRDQISKITENLNREHPSTIMLTLNSKLNFEEAKLVSAYNDWKKF